MEEMRRRLLEEGSTQLFKAQGSKDRIRQASAQHAAPLSPPKSIISISDSDESSIMPGSVTSKTVSGASDNEQDSDASIRVTQHTKPQPKFKAHNRVILDSDEEEDDYEPAHTPPVVHVPRNLAPITNTVASPPLPKEVTPKAFVGSNGFTKHPTAIKAPLLAAYPDFGKPPSNSRGGATSSDEAKFETFEVPEAYDVYDPKKTVADAEKDLKDLVSQSMNDVVEDVDMSMAEVEGFKDNIRLLPHQIIGRQWMKDRETGKKLGGILADDMGLGKTIQTIARIVDGKAHRSDKEAGFAAATLVVCPVSLVSQWVSEIDKMAIGLRVMEHHGPTRERDPEKLRRAHVVVTSYNIVASEYAAYEDEPLNKPKTKVRKPVSNSDSESDSEVDHFGRALQKNKKTTAKGKRPHKALFEVNWWRIVLDEAHNIKNRKTKMAVACCALESKYRWCLTGTPLQNNVEELFSLLQFLRIRPLNDWDTFNAQINKPIKSGKSARPMKRLHVVLSAIMLRRQKDTLLNGKALIELPERSVETISCEFDDDEQAFYEALKEKVNLQINKFIKSGQVMTNYTCMMVLLLRLRQACNHPSLVSKDFATDKEAVQPVAAKGNDLDDGEDLADLFGSMGITADRKCQLCQTVLTRDNKSPDDDSHCSDCADLARQARRKSLAARGSNLPPDSAKIRKILQLLDEIEDRSDGEEKTIIFSQFTSMLDLIEPFLKEKRIKFVRYDGSMKKDDREVSLNKIRNSVSTKVILISFKAGSTGLNLTACNNVILVDLWWNPALEDQAFDRAHRFGQTRKVNIFKLTIENTVEERILKLQDSKRSLAKAALSGEKLAKGNTRLGIEDLMALFRPGHDED